MFRAIAEKARDNRYVTSVRPHSDRRLDELSAMDRQDFRTKTDYPDRYRRRLPARINAQLSTYVRTARR